MSSDDARLVLVWQKNPGPARIHRTAECSSLANSDVPKRDVRFAGKRTAGWLLESEARALADSAVCRHCA